MWTFPVLLDSRPRYVGRARPASLLLLPLGEATVFAHLLVRLQAITGTAPLVVTRFGADPAYDEAIRAVCPEVEGILSLPEFLDRLSAYEPSDHLLLTDPECFPLDARDPALGRLAEQDDEALGASHLLAMQGGGEGTREFVDADASGRIRAIQRYYEAVTWPLAAGVACSRIPVSSLRVAYELPVASLQRLRRTLAAEGVPSRDVPLTAGAAHLGSEAGLLALNERLVLEAVSRRPESNGRRAGTSVHPHASLIGPVLVHTGAEVEEGATVIGPSVLGPGSRVGRGAIVAQSIVGAGVGVPPGEKVRHRVFLDPAAGPDARPDAAQPLQDTGAGTTEEWETTAALQQPTIAEHPIYRSVKRSLDVTAAVIGLVLLAPLALVLAALVKLESRGPVFFGHLREGMNGRPFRCWKFRTMRVGADVQQRKLQGLNQMDGPQFKVKRDPRRTRVGRILTATNVDELPQLWNVLVGDMSFVGPRPSPFRENQICVPWREGRLSVRPGVTGLWQVCRHDRDKSDFHQWIYYDLLYVRHLSASLDLRILGLTLLSFAKGGSIPLSWLLPPEKYGERRSRARAAGERGAAPARRRRDRVVDRATAPERAQAPVPAETGVRADG